MESNTQIIYNVTTMVNNTIVSDWKEWMKQHHIPAVMQTKCFTHFVFSQLMDVDETEGKTFTVQYFASTSALYELYIQQFAPNLRQQTIDKWQQQIIAFKTVMQVLH